MAQNVTIAGASYEDVSGIEVPKTGNNAGTALFSDVTDTTAEAGDVVSGKYFYSAAGVKTAGTRSATSLDPDVSNENLLLDSTVTPVIDTPDRVKTFHLKTYTTYSNYRLLTTGLRSYDGTSKCIVYSVSPGTILYLNIPAETPGVYQFQTSSGVPTSGTNSYLVGNVVTTAVNDFITVPANATYLIVSVAYSNNTYEVRATWLDVDTVDSISRITLPNADAYDIKDNVARQGFLFGYVDTVASTTSNFKVVAPGVTELRNGTAIYVHNDFGGSTSTNITLNVNNLGAKNVYIPGTEIRATGLTFASGQSHLVIYNEYYRGGSWLIDCTVTNTVQYNSSTRIPSEGAVYNFVSDRISNSVPPTGVDSTNTIIYITANSGDSLVDEVDTVVQRWPRMDSDNPIPTWVRIDQDWPTDGEPSHIVPDTLLCTEVVDFSDDHGGNGYDYTLYSQMLYNGYYELQFTWYPDY